MRCPALQEAVCPPVHRPVAPCEEPFQAEPCPVPPLGPPQEARLEEPHREVRQGPVQAVPGRVPALELEAGQPLVLVRQALPALPEEQRARFRGRPVRQEEHRARETDRVSPP